MKEFKQIFLAALCQHKQAPSQMKNLGLERKYLSAAAADPKRVGNINKLIDLCQDYVSMRAKNDEAQLAIVRMDVKVYAQTLKMTVDEVIAALQGEMEHTAAQQIGKTYEASRPVSPNMAQAVVAVPHSSPLPAQTASGQHGAKVREINTNATPKRGRKWLLVLGGLLLALLLVWGVSDLGTKRTDTTTNNKWTNVEGDLENMFVCSTYKVYKKEAKKTSLFACYTFILSKQEDTLCYQVKSDRPNMVGSTQENAAQSSDDWLIQEMDKSNPSIELGFVIDDNLEGLTDGGKCKLIKDEGKQCSSHPNMPSWLWTAINKAFECQQDKQEK